MADARPGRNELTRSIIGNSRLHTVGVGVSDLVASAVVRAHLSGSHTCGGVVALLNEADLLRLAVALERDVINHVNSAIDELLFGKQCLEDELSVGHVQPVKVLSLDLILSCDHNTI